MIACFENQVTPTTPRLLDGSRPKTNGEYAKTRKPLMKVRMNEMKVIPIASDVQRSPSNQGNQVHRDLHPSYVGKTLQTGPSNQGNHLSLHAHMNKEKEGRYYD